MNIQFRRTAFGFAVGLGFSVLCSAATGPLATVTATGGSSNYNINVYLNGLGPLSGQQWTIVTGYNLSIAPTIDTCYAHMGAEVTTPGLAITAGCDSISGSRCIFSACSSSPRSLTVSGSARPPTCQGPNGACRVFLSQGTTTGNIAHDGYNGIPAANSICNNDSNRPDNGTYNAWLADIDTLATNNIRYDPSLTYITLSNNNLVIADAQNLLTSGTLLNPITTAGHFVYTGADASGIYNHADCNSWSSTSFEGSVGFSSLTTAQQWSNVSTATCVGAHPIYCFEAPS